MMSKATIDSRRGTLVTIVFAAGFRHICNPTSIGIVNTTPQRERGALIQVGHIINSIPNPITHLNNRISNPHLELLAYFRSQRWKVPANVPQ